MPEEKKWKSNVGGTIFGRMSSNGRFYVKQGGRTFVVEPIGNPNAREKHGDIDPITKKMTGSYGEKYPGTIHPSESIISEDNGFKNIVTLEPGHSPFDYINKLLEEKE